MRDGVIGEGADSPAHRLIAIHDLGGVEQPGADQQSCGAEKRVAFVVRGDLAGVAVAHLGVGTGVRHKSHDAQVQERGRALGADVGRGGEGSVIAGGEIGAISGEVPHRRPGGVCRRDPARGRPHADAQAIVLADEQHWHRQPLIGDLAGGVDSSGCGRVVGRGVAETGNGDRIARPPRRHAELAGAVDGESDADSARQVGRDG